MRLHLAQPLDHATVCLKHSQGSLRQGNARALPLALSRVADLARAYYGEGSTTIGL